MVSTFFTVGVIVAWTSVIVANNQRETVFILQLPSNVNISFNMDMFERFYRCLQSENSSSCLVHHTHTSLTHWEANNVTFESHDSPVFDRLFLKTSYCVSNTAGITSCRKWNTDNLRNETGIHFGLACDGGICNKKCVYINNGNSFFIIDIVIKLCDNGVVQTESTNIYKQSPSLQTAVTVTDRKTSAQRTLKPHTTKSNTSTLRSVNQTIVTMTTENMDHKKHRTNPKVTWNTTVGTVTLTTQNTNYRPRTAKPTAQTTSLPAWTADTSTNVLPLDKEHDKVASDSGIMIGIIVGIIVALLIVITIACLYHRNRDDNQDSCHCSILACRSNTKALTNGCSRFFTATVCLTKIRNLRQSSNDGQNRSCEDVPVTYSSDDIISTTYAVPTVAAAKIANNGPIYSKLHQVIVAPENPYNVASDGNDKCVVDSAYETVDTTPQESGSGIVLGDGKVEIIDIRNTSQLQEFSHTNCSSRRISTPENAERGTKSSSSYVNNNVSSSSVPQETKSHIYFELEKEAKNNPV